MCGFAGEFVFDTSRSRASLELVEKTAENLIHRGPDSSGGMASPCGSCAMAFRRLKVIDLELSEQPFSSDDGHITLVFNGEIYNYVRLRNDLESEGRKFKTTGDTEVLLAMYERYGLEMLDKLEGMFAIAIFDGRSQQLHLIRDRFGVKPLWLAKLRDRIVFASEAKAFQDYTPDAIDMSVNLQALGYYLNFGYIPAPMSIWNGLGKLPPGAVMTVKGDTIESRKWWRPPTEIVPIGRRDAIVRVRELISSAVMKRLRSDVPLGVLLSGGIDSSIVAALACKLLNGSGNREIACELKTFSAGFAESRFDERPFARQVARKLGTDHTELQISPDPNMLDSIVSAYDEPFGDSSALATMLLARTVRGHVTVALGGDGGDEAFAGYDRHRAMWIIQRMGAMKSLTAIAAGSLLDKLAPHNEKSRLRRFVRFAKGINSPPTLRYMAYRQLMGIDDFNDLLTDDLAMAADMNEHINWFADTFEDGDFPTDLGAAQRCDMLTYLPDDLLVKADIASMATSLELRSPMLDHHVMEFGLSLPDELKVNSRGGKRILRDAFIDMLGPEVFNRPKTGFGVPIDSWLRGEMLSQLKETLLDQSFIDRGWVRPSAMQRMIDQHATGQADHRHSLWALLMLGRWAAKL